MFHIPQFQQNINYNGVGMPRFSSCGAKIEYFVENTRVLEPITRLLISAGIEFFLLISDNFIHVMFLIVLINKKNIFLSTRNTDNKIKFRWQHLFLY